MRVRTHTHSPVNPQKCSICSSFSSRGYTQTTDGWALSECSKASSQILMHPIKITKQKAGTCTVSGLWLLLEILKCMLLSVENMNEVLWYKRLTPCVHRNKVHSHTDILDSSCDKLDGLSHFVISICVQTTVMLWAITTVATAVETDVSCGVLFLYALGVSGSCKHSESRNSSVWKRPRERLGLFSGIAEARTSWLGLEFVWFADYTSSLKTWKFWFCI